MVFSFHQFLYNHDNSLILIDELISGTDPKQAQAISLAILDKIKTINALVPAMQEAHKNLLAYQEESGEDIHAATAKKVFNLHREPTSQERRKAKTLGLVWNSLIISLLSAICVEPSILK